MPIVGNESGCKSQVQIYVIVFVKQLQHTQSTAIQWFGINISVSDHNPPWRG